MMPGLLLEMVLSVFICWSHNMVTSTSCWYVTNQTLHSDLHIPYVHSVLQDYIYKHWSALESHPNPLMEPLIHTTHTRRLKQRWTF